MVANDKFAVSAIIPVYNGEDFLEEAVESILNQKLPVKEIIIIDDCSTDNTLSLANQIAKDNKAVQVLSQPINRGVSVARNIGYEAARFDWVLFLDADDIADPRLLELESIAILDYSLKHNKAAFLAYPAYFIINKDGEVSKEVFRSKQVAPGDILGWEFVRNQIITTSGTLINKESIIKTKGFDETLRYSEDYDLWLRLAQLGDFVYVDQPLIKIRRHENNISKDILKMIRGEKAVLNRYSTSFIQNAIFKRDLPWSVNLKDFIAVLFKMERWEEGFSYINQLLSEDRNSASGNFLKGVYYLYQKDWQNAKESFEFTLKIDERNGAALNNLGGILLMEGNHQEASVLLKKALEIHPNFIDVQNNIKLLHSLNKINSEKINFTWRELRPQLLNY